MTRMTIVYLSILEGLLYSVSFDQLWNAIPHGSEADDVASLLLRGASRNSNGKHFQKN
jgi:hypothetical protein